jgi:hypothetical protein
MNTVPLCAAFFLSGLVPAVGAKMLPTASNATAAPLEAAPGRPDGGSRLRNERRLPASLRPNDLWH